MFILGCHKSGDYLRFLLPIIFTNLIASHETLRFWNSGGILRLIRLALLEFFARLCYNSNRHISRTQHNRPPYIEERIFDLSILRKTI